MLPNKTNRVFRTTESFKQELLLKNEAYANKEFEITGEFISLSTPIEVKDKYGILFMAPENLLKNGKPRLLSAFNKNLSDKNNFFDGRINIKFCAHQNYKVQIHL